MDPLDELALRRIAAAPEDDEATQRLMKRIDDMEAQILNLNAQISGLNVRLSVHGQNVDDLRSFARRIHGAVDQYASITEKPWRSL